MVCSSRRNCTSLTAILVVVMTCVCGCRSVPICRVQTGDSRSDGADCQNDSDCDSENCDNLAAEDGSGDSDDMTCKCLPGTGGTGGSGGTGGTGGTGGSGGTGGTAGSRGSEPDLFADKVDGTLTSIEDGTCDGNCIGEPANATGMPDGKGGNTTSVSLGTLGQLGLIFDPDLCVVDDDPNTPDIVVYEVGGVQNEDFSLKVARAGEPNLAAGEVVSRTSFNEPERHLDLTARFGSGMVDRIQIIDIDDNRDEREEPGFETGWGADIDAVGCFSR